MKRLEDTCGDKTGIIVSIADSAEQRACMTAWRHLSADALEPNPFYDFPFCHAWYERFAVKSNVIVLMAWKHVVGDEKQLIGVLPLEFGAVRFGVFRVAHAAIMFGAWTPPLLRQADAGEALKALIDKAAELGIRTVVFPYLAINSRTASVLSDTIDRLRLKTSALKVFERAILVRESAAVKAAGKEARRLVRRLAERGAIDFKVYDERNAALDALPIFLRLEAGGWKGRRGTAFEALSDGPAFLRAAIGQTTARGGLQIAILRVGDQPIAAALLLTAGRHASFFKIGFDAGYARYSPGLLLARELTAWLLASERYDRIDSLAEPNYPMINRVWDSRQEIASVAISTKATAGWFSLGVTFERSREQARVRSQRLRSRARTLRCLRRHLG